MTRLREAPFALRVVRRHEGDAAIVYRRGLAATGRERLTRLTAIAPIAFTAGAGLLRAAVRNGYGTETTLSRGPFLPLDADWGARTACYGVVAQGLRDPEHLYRAAENLRHADGTEAAWWLGLMTRPSGERAVRALRILTEAVK